MPFIMEHLYLFLLLLSSFTSLISNCLLIIGYCGIPQLDMEIKLGTQVSSLINLGEKTVIHGYLPNQKM